LSETRDNDAIRTLPAESVRYQATPLIGLRVEPTHPSVRPGLLRASGASPEASWQLAVARLRATPSGNSVSSPTRVGWRTPAHIGHLRLEPEV
jgi:hypothetical protein